VLLAAVQANSRDQAAARPVPGQLGPMEGVARGTKEERRTSSSEILNSRVKLLSEKSIVKWLLSSLGAHACCRTRPLRPGKFALQTFSHFCEYKIRLMLYVIVILTDNLKNL